MTSAWVSPAQFDQPFANGAGGFVEGGRILVRALPDRIGSDLPDHQIGLLGDDVGIEPLKLERRFLAANSAVDHGDLSVRILRLEKRQQPLRIGLDTAVACRRRRADRDDLGSSSDALRKAGQAVLEWNRLNRNLGGIAVHGSPVCCSRANVGWKKNSAPRRDHLAFSEGIAGKLSARSPPPSFLAFAATRHQQNAAVN
jgi:hypothetical protein